MNGRMTANASAQVRRVAVAVTVRMSLVPFLRGEHGKHASYEHVAHDRNSGNEQCLGKFEYL